MLASAAGHTEVVHFLAQHDPSCILRQDMRGRDAIMHASSSGHDTVVQILLTYVPGGAEAALARTDIEGNTALHYASGNGHLLVLRTLLAAGADPYRRNVWNWRARDYCATVRTEVYYDSLVPKEGENGNGAPSRSGSPEARKKGFGARLVGLEVGD
jgi:FOG: Ankyrin repeat